MPRVKKTKDSADVATKPPKKTVKKKKVSHKVATEKKATTPQRGGRSGKAKPVMVNIIEDELDFGADDAFFPDSSLAEVKEVASKKQIKEEILDSSEEEIEETDEWSLENEEVDKQKQFFSDLVSDIKKKRGEEETGEKDGKDKSAAGLKAPGSRRTTLSLYRRLVWKFLILVGFLVAVVFYLSFSKLTILITPQVEAMNDIIFLKVANNEESVTQLADAREQVSGAVYEAELSVEKTYVASGEEFLGEEVSGKVILINNNNKAQALVATTRLLAADGKLFRLKDSVNIPAGGTVEAEIYADRIAAEMAIGPSRFTIPGLWVGLQDKIYAESKEAFVYKQRVRKVVKASDIQLASSEASSLILAKAKEIKPLRSQDEMIYQIQEPIDININAKVGDNIEEFTLRAKAKVVVVSFSGEEVARLASAKLNIMVPDDKELLGFKPESMSYVLENYSDEDQVATLKASFSGEMILRGNADIINREKLVNLKAEQIATYLRDYPEIGNYELEFYPGFVKKAPHLVDRIKIEIRK